MRNTPVSLVTILAILVFCSYCTAMTEQDNPDVQKYSPGDIVSWSGGYTAGATYIVDYNSSTDSYTYTTVALKEDGTWGRFLDVYWEEKLRQYPRNYVETRFPIKVAHVGLKDIRDVQPLVTSDVIIGPVKYHTEGKGFDLNDEYITIINIAVSDKNLKGWRIEDGDGHRYFIGDVILPAESRLTVLSGSGVDSVGEEIRYVHWGSNEVIWDNDEDTVYLYDEKGNLIDKFEYSVKGRN